MNPTQTEGEAMTSDRAETLGRFDAALERFRGEYGNEADLRDGTDVRLLLAILQADLIAGVERWPDGGDDVG
jgi:hypothetical protein